MQPNIQNQHAHPDIQHHLPGHRPEPARFSADLTWARAESERASRLKAYPSPPMSGSPPLPPKSSYETVDRGQGSYRSSNDPYYRTADNASPHSGDMRLQSMGPGSQPYAQQRHQSLQHQHSHSSMSNYARPYPSEPHDRLPYPSYARPEDQQMPSSMHHMGSYPSPSHMQQGPPMPGYAPYLPPLPGPSSMQQGYPVSPHNPVPIQIPSPVAGLPGGPDAVPPYASPKTQRKTKGHVASACVPCKRAHLRCDAQRPCSRCLSNGREDACVDVQHKKRGRPRLREERDMRYEPAGRESSGGHSAEPSIRRPVSTLYGQPTASIGSGFVERGSASDAYPASLSISTRAHEPMVYITMDLELAKASNSFLDAIGRPFVKGMSLLDIISPMERERVATLQRQMQDERQRNDPQYLPPIFVKRDEDRVIQSLGMTADDVGRYSLDWQEYLTFSSSDGQQRAFPVRLGLAKQDSIYFIVLLLHVAARPLGHGHPISSPHSRDMPYAYQQQQQQQQHQQNSMYAHPTPVSATFDMNRSRIPNDPTALPHRPTPPGPSSMMPGMGSGMASSYGPSPSRTDYPAPAAPSYQTPRSELSSGPLPHRQPQQVGAGGYQLPPIRHRPEARPMEGPSGSRDDRSRVDIGGLVDQTDAPRRMH